MQASVVIVTHGQWAMTKRCLRSLQLALGDKLGRTWEIVVVDNDSPDETPRRLLEWSDRVRVELREDNLNFAGGCNLGAELAQGDTLIFLNNDTEVPAGALEALATQVQEPGIGAAGCRLLFPDGTVQHAGVAFIRGTALGGAPMPQHVFHHHDAELAVTAASFETDAVTAACVATRHDAFIAVGGFEEGYVNGLEDIDLCLRLRLAGYRIVYRGDITVTHHEGASRGTGTRLFDTPQKLAAATANDALFVRRWVSLLEQDDELAASVWGARLRDRPPPRSSAATAEVLLAGPVSGLGPASDEARSILHALAGAGLQASAVDLPHTNVIAPLQGEMAVLVNDALETGSSPNPQVVYLPGGPHDTLYLPNGQVRPEADCAVRLGWPRTSLDIRDAGRVLAVSRAAAARLRADGVPERKLLVMPPLVRRYESGRGGAGLLVVLPTHLPDLMTTVIRALIRLPDTVHVRLLPTAHRRKLHAEIASMLAGAEVLGPCVEPQAYAALAGASDLVLCADPSDPFERRALIAAGVGTRPLSLTRDGPAFDVLGSDAVATPASLAESLSAALERPRAARELTEAVRRTCDPRRIMEFLALER